jgi:hypothetical protein
MSELVRVSYGLWRPPAAVDRFPGRAAALLSACPDGTVVAGSSAGRLHGHWLPELPEVPLRVIVHPDIAAPSDRAGNRRADIQARRRILLPDEVTLLDGIPVTTEARTWFDLAQELKMADLIAAGDSALRGTATLDEMQEIINRAFHRPGVVRARTALPFLDARSRSRPESHLRYAIVSSGLPKPAVNEPIHDAHGGWLAEPDLSYEDVRLALEYNGADHAALRRMRRDITRGVDISGSGWRTEVFGPVQVFGRPDQTASLVRQLRYERRHLLPRARALS